MKLLNVFQTKGSKRFFQKGFSKIISKINPFAFVTFYKLAFP